MIFAFEICFSSFVRTLNHLLYFVLTIDFNQCELAPTVEETMQLFEASGDRSKRLCVKLVTS